MNIKKFFYLSSYKDKYRRYKLLKSLKRAGSNFQFDIHSTILHPELVEIGDNVFIGEQAHISALVKIGNNVMFGPRPVILGGDHYFGVYGESNRFLKPKECEAFRPIIIGNEVWVGASAIILGGVTLGDGCVIGAGSIVKKSIPPFVVAVGNPCQPVKKIFSDDRLIGHLIKLGYSEDYAHKILETRNEMLISQCLTSLPVRDNTEKYIG